LIGPQHGPPILDVLKTLEKGEELIHLPARKEVLNAQIDDRIERTSTEHGG